jgi:hypothetical protein
MARQLIALKNIYETDYEGWLQATINLLKTRQLDLLDCEHLIEELEALGNEQKRAVESLLEQIIRHLLLYQYWATKFERNANHWEAEIIGFRTQLRRRLTSNLRHHLVEELPAIYRDALKFVIAKTKLNFLPSECPYTLEQILDENWLPTSSKNGQA